MIYIELGIVLKPLVIKVFLQFVGLILGSFQKPQVQLFNLIHLWYLIHQHLSLKCLLSSYSISCQKLLIDSYILDNPFRF